VTQGVITSGIRSKALGGATAGSPAIRAAVLESRPSINERL